MKEIQRYTLDFADEELHKDSSGVVCLWSDVEKLLKELDDMTAKAIAAVWLLPEEVEVSQLQEFRAHAKEVLMGKDKQTITRLQDELAAVRNYAEQIQRPPTPGVNAVYGFRASDKAGLRYVLMLTSVRHGSNGGLEIEVALP